MIVVCLYVGQNMDIGLAVTKEEWICQRCARKAGLVKRGTYSWYVADREHEAKHYMHIKLDGVRCCVCYRQQSECALIQTWCMEVKSNA